MALPLVPIMLAGGALIYVEAHEGPAATSPDNQYGPFGGNGVQGGQVSTTVGNSVTNGNTIVVGGNGSPAAPVLKNGHSAASLFGPTSIPLEQNLYPNPTNQNTGNDPVLGQKLDEINGYAEAAYNNLDDAAKQAGADAANKALNLDPPLKGDESWEALSGVVGGALGGAAGAYIGGPVGAKIGAILGAYLGVKIEDLISKNVDDLGNWLEGKWGDVYNQAQSWYNSAENDVQGAYDEVSSWF